MKIKSIIAIMCITIAGSASAQLKYPATRTDASVVDDYFGMKVADPYRWLEDDNSAEFNHDGHNYNCQRDSAVGRIGGVENLLYTLHQRENTRGEDDNRDNDGTEIFHTTVTKRMDAVGGFL